MEKVISPLQLNDILQGSPNFYPREYEKRTPVYMGSVLLPRPTFEGKFLSFDVVAYGIPGGTHKLTFQIPGTQAGQACTILGPDGTIHVPCDVPVQGIGIGSVAYYTTIALAPIFGHSKVKSDAGGRSLTAEDWWATQLEKGRAQYSGDLTDSDGSDALDTEMHAATAAKYVYMWRIGRPPDWLQKDINGKPMMTAVNQDLLKSIVRNFPAADRPRMMSNIYPSVPSIAREGVRLAMSNLGYLSSVMKPSIYFPKGMGEYTL